MEGDGIGRNPEISILDGREWNWKEPVNLKDRRKETELEGTWRSQKKMEGAGTGRIPENSKIDKKKWNLKHPGNLKNKLKEIKLEGTRQSQY